MPKDPARHDATYAAHGQPKATNLSKHLAAAELTDEETQLAQFHRAVEAQKAECRRRRHSY